MVDYSEKELERLRNQNNKFRQALQDIVNPFGKLTREAKEQGRNLSGMAYAITNDINFIKSIAKDALEKEDDFDNLVERIRRLQILLSRYGDPVRMANSPECQAEVGEALKFIEDSESSSEVKNAVYNNLSLDDFFNNLPIPTPMSDFKKWVDSVVDKKWTWVLNAKFKYVNLRLDTRTGICTIEDRDGNFTTFDQLMWQYSKENAAPPE